MTATTHSAHEWPEIDGVDSADIREQLRGDARLFMRLMRRLVADYANLGATLAAADTEGWSVRQSLAHKLKGAAGTLGVTKVFDCARDAEMAAKARNLTAYRQLMACAEAELGALGGKVRAADAAVATLRPQPSDQPELPGDTEPVDLAAFAALLRTQSLASLRKFDALEPRLNRLLGAEAGEALRGHIDHLRFDAAAELVERCLGSASAP